MWRGLKEREFGASRPRHFANQITAERSRSFELSAHKEIVSSHKGSITCLQIDKTEGRYLLVGSNDGSVGVYDTLQSTNYDFASHTYQHKALFIVDKRVHHGHRFAVTSVHWFPVDTGIFISGSFDNYVNVWDANTQQVATQFKMGGNVYAVGMSPAAVSNTLIAVGTEEHRVRLCDIESGADTHTLDGHRGPVRAVQWSVSSEWELMTGGNDGTIRFWDIRRAGTLRVLDQETSQIGRRPPVRKILESDEQIERVRAPSTDNFRKGLEKSRTTTSGGKVFQASAPLRNGGDRRKFQYRRPPFHDTPTSHYGAVTALTPTRDGMFLLSAGANSAAKLWDIESGCNILVNISCKWNCRDRDAGGGLSVSSDSSLLFMPFSSTVQVYDLWTGSLLKTLRGHFDAVTCCDFHPDQELYSGSCDRKILVWCPPSGGPEIKDEVEVRQQGPLGARPDKDAWSD